MSAQILVPWVTTPSSSAAAIAGASRKVSPSAGTNTAALPRHTVIHPVRPSRRVHHGLTTAASPKPAADTPTATPRVARPPALSSALLKVYRDSISTMTVSMP